MCVNLRADSLLSSEIKRLASNSGAPQIFPIAAGPVSRLRGGKATPRLTWKYLDIVTRQEIASTNTTFVSLDLQKILRIFPEFSPKIKCSATY